MYHFARQMLEGRLTGVFVFIGIPLVSKYWILAAGKTRSIGALDTPTDVNAARCQNSVFEACIL